MGARSYATIQCSIWEDADFLALSAEAKAAYFMLVTQPNIEACGALPLTLRRWAPLVAGGDPAQLVRWLNELSAARFVVLDKDTEEILVRTFAKYDGGYLHATRVKAVVRSAEAIMSPSLRGFVAAELDRLEVRHNVKAPGRPTPLPPDSGPGGSPVAVESLSSGTQVAPKSLSGGSPVPVETHPGASEVAPESHGSVVKKRKNNGTPHSTLLEGEPRAADAVPGEEPPSVTCSNHPDGTDDPCGPCKAARLARTEWDTARAAQLKATQLEKRRAARDARAAAIRDCDLCRDDGYRIVPGSAIPGGVCNHQPLNPGGRARAFAEISGGNP